MAGSFSVTIRCSFVGGDGLSQSCTAQRLCFERSSMGRVRGGGKFSLSFRSVRGSFVSSMPIRNHWFLGKRAPPWRLART